MSAYLDGSLELQEDGLRNENLASLGAEVADLGLEQLHLLAGTASSNLEEPVDYRVKIDLVLVSHLGTRPWLATARSNVEDIAGDSAQGAVESSRELAVARKGTESRRAESVSYRWAG